MKLPLKAFQTYFTRFQFVILTILLVLITSTVLAFYNLKRFETFATFNLQYEGILMANALGASVFNNLEHPNIAEIQAIIDRFSSAREYDIEINVMFLEEAGSNIVASNNRENIEETSSEEHHNLLASLKHGKPVVFVGVESNEEEERRELHEGRFLSITVPLYSNSKGVGSINAKLSLTPIDKKIETIRFSIQIATLLQVFLLLVGLMFLLKQFRKEKYKLLLEESRRYQAELKALQAQINPHFLFNTLNSISSLIPDEPDMAEDLTIELSELFRKILGASKDGWWSIGEELKLIENYLNIEKTRLKNRLQFSVDVTDDLKQIRIPCLIVEPLVENAVKHGINSTVSGGEIKIEIYEKNGLIIAVKDMLYINEKYPISKEPHGEKIGIQSIKKRLKILYGDHANFSLQKDKNGANAVITIKNPRSTKYGEI